MAFSIWNISCNSCERKYPRFRYRCPNCLRNNPHTLWKVIKVLFIIAALAVTVLIWIAVLKKSGWGSPS